MGRAARAVRDPLFRLCALTLGGTGAMFGCAIAPHDDLSAAGLLKRADAAMYAGKQAGKNCLRRGVAAAALARV
jgi:GGDEF domain-containing protein